MTHSGSLNLILNQPSHSKQGEQIFKMALEYTTGCRSVVIRMPNVILNRPQSTEFGLILYVWTLIGMPHLEISWLGMNLY